MNNELRTYALDEMHHRLRQVRSYSLLDGDGSKITVRAALAKSDPPTVSNPANQKTLSIAADAADDGTLFSWLDEVDGKPQLMTLAQIRSLGACLLNPGEMGFEPLKPVGELDAANLRIRFDVRVEALRPSFVAPFPRWRSSAGCECGQGRGPPLGELQDIVGEADEAPLVGDLLDAAQEKLTEAARLLDLSEHRLGQLLS